MAVGIDPKIHVQNSMSVLADTLQLLEMPHSSPIVTELAEELGQSYGGHYIQNGHALVAKGFLQTVRDALLRVAQTEEVFVHQYVAENLAAIADAYLKFGEETE